MNIVLIGYRASGKSTVGRLLAKSMDREFRDIDEIIEKRCGTSIREIVESRGWDYFRAVEKAVIAEEAEGDDLVIAPGGGAVLDSENVRALSKNGIIVWLRSDPKVIAERIHRDGSSAARRPALTEKGKLEEIQEVMSARIGFYTQAADFAVDTSMESPFSVMTNIMSRISNLRSVGAIRESPLEESAGARGVR